VYSRPILTAAPASEPLTTAELREWCRISNTASDAVIAAIAAGARELCERQIGRQFVTASYYITMDSFPWLNGWQGIAGQSAARDWPVIRMPCAPLISVESVRYYDLGGTLRTLPTTVYDVDAASDPGRVALAYGQTWPVVRPRPGAVRIDFTCGYGTASDVPDGLKNAIRFIVAQHFENRGESADASNLEIPAAAERLLKNHWNGELEYGA
jgi:uncharacterized phiE125 gp8 family phage protein